MKISGNTLRIGIAAAIIVGTIGWLAFTGYGANKSYYVTIAELGGLGDKAYHSQLRVEGFVQPGSIEQNGTHVDFVMNEFESHSPKAGSGRLLKVVYKALSRLLTLSKTMRRRWRWVPMDVTEYSTPTCFRPSAQANTRPCSPARRRQVLPTPNPPLRPAPRRQRPPPTRPQPTDRMSANPSEPARTTLCARLDQVSKLFGSLPRCARFPLTLNRAGATSCWARTAPASQHF